MNLAFIREIDHGYFAYISAINVEQLDGEEKQRAATAIRTCYMQGLETLFMLIGAAIFAPDCVAGYMLKCRPRDLRQMLDSIAKKAKMTNKIQLDQLSWPSIASALICYKDNDQQDSERTKGLFASLWENFASDYYDDDNIKEYNSLKHGYRVHAGGFGMRIGITPRPDASPETLHNLGSSDYGTSFYTPKLINGGKRDSEDPHFYLGKIMLNWNPHSIAAALELISISINNIILFLEWRNGAASPQTKFLRPIDDGDYERPWLDRPTLIRSIVETPVREDQIKKFSKDEIKQLIEQKYASGESDNPKDSPS